MTLLMNVTDPERLAAFDEILGVAQPGLRIVKPGEAYDPEEIRYLFTWQPLEDWVALPNLEVVFSVSAGVDQFTALPAHIALVKMVDPLNTERVADYVLAACLVGLRDFPRYGEQQRQRLWQPAPGRTIAETRVTVLGLGQTGRAAAAKLVAAGFETSGWARSAHEIEGMTCRSGEAGLTALLAEADIVVCLLPLTEATRGILSKPLFARMKPGASLVHAGRGPQCNFTDLAEALETGQLGNAVIDVFETEPLPKADPCWDLPNCLITPHVAGRTGAETAARNVAQNLARLTAGQELLWRVDRQKGY
ncbi:2-hydroxyacid dehydrogenase [Celeribacter neptunius]|uniref:Glyoxylate/hydroxypyruvate reductase A n=1 Tax=Celeribacter neptunius TaxID=588602 RepID=A0A1I3PK75_9RHOB|nr:glyoxylate/hydroxypyruvate reductase A [Celeribacter neptunius]SFJ21739.1 glyoxylate/hydroxypyruvate reductase A [Celeribacter neptunius]